MTTFVRKEASGRTRVRKVQDLEELEFNEESCRASYAIMYLRSLQPVSYEEYRDALKQYVDYKKWFFQNMQMLVRGVRASFQENKRRREEEGLLANDMNNNSNSTNSNLSGQRDRQFREGSSESDGLDATRDTSGYLSQEST